MNFLKPYIPYTRENTISNGLAFAHDVAWRGPWLHENNAYSEFKEKILFCKDNKCPYSEDEFRTLANKISPGLAQVDIITNTIQAVNPK